MQSYPCWNCSDLIVIAVFNNDHSPGLLILKYCPIGNNTGIWQYFLGIAAGIAVYFRCSFECGTAILLSTFFGNT
jgi:hypothetical protein